MNRFQARLIQFMMGRRGFDQFSRDLMIFALFLILLDFFVSGSMLNTLALLLMFYSYYRALSRNIVKRQAENNWYFSFIGNNLRGYLNRDYKHYRYFKCPNCKQTLRAPKGRGKIRVTCSRCHGIFEKKV
ncbi:MAG: zf-TFIIB domain-containing protein [Firmicutes bacterium]|nr:zf-TFIIB domain-containing protein [Bacillota bacterium]